jgi:hypothetical protein
VETAQDDFDSARQMKGQRRRRTAQGWPKMPLATAPQRQIAKIIVMEYNHTHSIPC